MASKGATYSVVLNSTNVVQNNFNNTFKVDLPGSSVKLENYEMAVSSIQLYNSVFNINSSVYDNNTFSIQIPTAASFSTINVTLPNGYYSYSDINNFVQKQLIAAGAYLVNSSGQNVYPIQFSANSVYYACQVDLSSCNTTLPGGWSFAASGLWSSLGGLPTTAYTPKIILSSNITSIFGISAGTYPSSSTTTPQSILSDITPQISPVQSYFLRCNVVNNPMNSVSDVLYSFSTQGTTIGQLISINPNEYQWITLPNQSISSISCTIVDQNYNFCQFQDDNIVIVLLFRKRS